MIITYKVSHIRIDGRTGETTFSGYNAGGCASQNFNLLSSLPNVQYVCIIQQFEKKVSGSESEILTWYTKKMYNKGGFLNAS